MDKSRIPFILFVLTALIGAVNIATILTRATCEAKWIDSGFNFKYSAFGGCLIQLKDGTWIPAANYRSNKP